VLVVCAGVREVLHSVDPNFGELAMFVESTFHAVGCAGARGCEVAKLGGGDSREVLNTLEKERQSADEDLYVEPRCCIGCASDLTPI
jgi:hypothetical protein